MVPSEQRYCRIAPVGLDLQVGKLTAFDLFLQCKLAVKNDTKVAYALENGLSLTYT